MKNRRGIFHWAPSPDWRLYATLFQAVPRARLLLCGLVAGAQAAAIWPVAFLLRYIFDRALPAADVRALLLAGAGVFLASLAQAAFTLYARALTLDVVKQAIAKLRCDLVERLLELPRAFHLQAERGVLHATVVQDTERLDDMSAVLITQFMPAAVSSLGLLAVLAWLRWPLCLALLALWPLLFFASRHLRRRMRVSVRAFHTAFERYSQATLELLRRLDLTRMQAAENVEIAWQRNRIDALRRDGRAVAWEATVHGTGHEVLGMLTALAILLLGGTAVIHGTMTVGSLVSFFFIARALNNAQNQLFQLVPKLLAGQDALRSLAPLLTSGDPVLTSPPYPADPLGLSKKRPARFAGGIEFRDVSFSYQVAAAGGQDTVPVLRGVRLRLTPGETVALIGSNGAGKSTLLHLLLGFYRPDAGDIRADGQPYASLDLAWLRAQMGVVPQSPQFFHGTVRENLVYGTTPPALEAVQQALTRAGADAFVGELPHGLETMIGDDGWRLSGGQRQRLALARALLREPALLVLDEPTTHLDPAAVDTLVATLRAAEPRPTILLVSHDLAQIGRCGIDHVYELRDGRLRHARPEASAPASDSTVDMLALSLS